MKNKKEVIIKWLKKNFSECIRCNEKRFHLLDFHHNNKKDLDIARTTNGTASVQTTIRRLEKETKQCTRLCSNCHRDFHFLNKTKNITIDEYIK